MSLAVRRRPGALHRQPLLALSAVAGGVSLATLGAVLSVGMLATRNSSTPGAPAYAVGRDAPTSFGSIAVQDVALVDGLSAADLGGMTHGIQRLVPEDQLEVQVSLLLTNSTARSVDYAFARRFRLVSAAGFEATLLAGSADPDGSLPGHSAWPPCCASWRPVPLMTTCFSNFATLARHAWSASRSARVSARTTEHPLAAWRPYKTTRIKRSVPSPSRR